MADDEERQGGEVVAELAAELDETLFTAPGISFKDTPFAQGTKTRSNSQDRNRAFFFPNSGEHPDNEAHHEKQNGEEARDLDHRPDQPLRSDGAVEEEEEEEEEEDDDGKGEEESLVIDDGAVVEEMANAQSLSTPQDLGEGEKRVVPLDETRNPNYRKYANEEPSDPNWSQHKKHIFVLSNAGKPIFSRYGDESKLSGVMGILSAIISFAESENDVITEIDAGDHKIIFCQKGPLYLVSVSRTHEPSEDLVMQLEYVHSQIICLLTAGVNRIFENRADFDLRNLLSGTEKMFDNLVSFMDHDASVFANAIHCLRLGEGTRRSVGRILLESRTSSVLYGMIVAKHQLVNLIRPRKHPLLPSDLHLILNFINSGTSFKTNETWTPICLPRFNEKGFLHSYIRYLADDVCLMLVSTKAESFYELSNCAKKISTSLEVSGCLKEIIQATKDNTYSVSQTGNPDILHFIYISRVTSQLAQPALTPPYTHRKNRKRLFRLYQHIHNRSLSHQLYYHTSKFETIFAWETFHFVLFATFGPLETKGVVVKACNQLLRWIKSEEGRLFIMNSPVF